MPIYYMIKDGIKVIYQEDGNKWEAYDINDRNLMIQWIYLRNYQNT